MIKRKNRNSFRIFDKQLIIVCIFVLALAVGYVMDIVKFCQCDFSNKTSWKAEIIYGIGITTGLGVVIGYINLGE